MIVHTTKRITLPMILFIFTIRRKIITAAMIATITTPILSQTSGGSVFILSTADCASQGMTYQLVGIGDETSPFSPWSVI